MLYNASSYTSGHPKVRVLYGSALCKAYPKATMPIIGDEVWDTDWDQFADFLKTIEQDYIMFDVEHWPLNHYDDKTLNDSIALYRAHLKFIKEIRPDVTLCTFMGPVENADWIKPINHIGGAARMIWGHMNQAQRQLADYLDWVSPVLYWATQSSWFMNHYIDLVLSEAMTFKRDNKKIVPIISMRLQNSTGADADMLSPSNQAWFIEKLKEYGIENYIYWDYGANNGQWPQDILI